MRCDIERSHSSAAYLPSAPGAAPLPRCPAKLHANKGYDGDRLRRWLRRRGIRHHIARKGVESPTRLGDDAGNLGPTRLDHPQQ